MNSAFSLWLQSFLPSQASVDRAERLRASMGALFGVALTGLISFILLGDTPGAIWLVAPMGASTVLLFAVPTSPLAQPWAVIGGNLVGGLVGVTCAKLIPLPYLAAGVAMALSFAGMFWLRCLHPPSGAVALTVVLGGPAVHAAGYSFVFVPIMVNSVLLLAMALIYNNATGRRFPHSAHPTPTPSKAPVPTETEITPLRTSIDEDLDVVLQRYNQVLDISRDDLKDLFEQVEIQAYRRRSTAINCASIMHTDIASAEFATDLREAWHIMRQHHIKALPILDRGRRIIGMVTSADFVAHAERETANTLGAKLQQLLSKTGLSHTQKPEAIGQIMHSPVITAHMSQSIVDLVPLMTTQQLRYVPIVDDERRLVGMVTQSEMLAALYERKLISAPQ